MTQKNEQEILLTAEGFLELETELNDLKIRKLETYTKPANLQKYLGKQYDAIERDIKRAEVIKQIINSN